MCMNVPCSTERFPQLLGVLPFVPLARPGADRDERGHHRKRTALVEHLCVLKRIVHLLQRIVVVEEVGDGPVVRVVAVDRRCRVQGAEERAVFLRVFVGEFVEPREQYLRPLPCVPSEVHFGHLEARRIGIEQLDGHFARVEEHYHLNQTASHIDLLPIVFMPFPPFRLPRGLAGSRRR